MYYTGVHTTKLEDDLSCVRWIDNLQALREFSALSRQVDARYTMSDCVKTVFERDQAYNKAKTEMALEVENNLNKRALKNWELHVILPYNPTYDAEKFGN